MPTAELLCVFCCAVHLLAPAWLHLCKRLWPSVTVVVVESPAGAHSALSLFGTARSHILVSGVEPSSALAGKVAVQWELIAIDDSRAIVTAHSARQLVNHLACNLHRPCSLTFRTDCPCASTCEGTVQVIGINLGITFLSVVWFTLLLPNHLLPKAGLLVAGTLTFAWTSTITHGVFNYWCALLTPPGFVSEGLANEWAQDVRPIDPLSEIRCVRCQWSKPPHSHHCATCRRCVRRMDHHCPWLDTCVGEQNYRYFLLTEAQLSLGLFVFGSSALVALLPIPPHAVPYWEWSWWRSFSWLHGKQEQSAGWLIIAAVVYFIFLMVLQCALLHVRLLATQQSTIDDLASSDDRNGAPQHSLRPAPASVHSWLDNVFHPPTDARHEDASQKHCWRWPRLWTKGGRGRDGGRGRLFSYPGPTVALWYALATRYHSSAWMRWVVEQF